MLAHVISLLESPRRQVAEQRAASVGLTVSFFDAIEASKSPLVESRYASSEKSFRSRYGRRQTVGELACLLSHQALYESLARERSAHCLIFEDDFVPLVDANGLREVLATAVAHDADIVILGYSKVDNDLERAIDVSNPLMQVQRIASTNRVIGQRCYETTCGAVSYLVSPRFLDKMANNLDYGRLADDWTYHQGLGLKIRHVSPLCFREDYLNMSSSLELSRSNSSQRNAVRLPQYLRPLWRRCLGLVRRLQFYANKMNGL